MPVVRAHRFRYARNSELPGWCLFAAKPDGIARPANSHASPAARAIPKMENAFIRIPDKTDSSAGHSPCVVLCSILGLLNFALQIFYCTSGGPIWRNAAALLRRT